MKKLIIAALLVAGQLFQGQSALAYGSDHDISRGSGGCSGFVCGFDYLALSIFFAPSYMVSQAGENLSNAATQVIQASVMASQKIVISAVEVSGNIVKVTYRVSIKGSQLALKLGKDVIEFSATFLRKTFEASLKAAGQTLEFLAKAVVNGVEVVVRATAIVAGTAGVVVGHILVLAAMPAVTIGVILNVVGQDLYYASNKN